MASRQSARRNSIGARRKTASRGSEAKDAAAARKTKLADTKGNVQQNFLKDMDENISNKDMDKFLVMLTEAANKDDPSTVQRCCQTIIRISQTDAGFFVMYKAGMLETLSAIMENMEGVELDATMAYNAILQQAANWLASVDHVEFFKLPQVLDLASRFAGEYKSVALSAVATLDRFAMQQPVHRLSILQADGLHLLHRVLSAHRSPEFCQETMVLIFHVCDVPAENIKPKLLDELSIVKSVVETLEQAPVNMRLQITGLRLLALWQNLDDKKIDKAMKEAQAPECKKNAIDNLSKAGFTHAAAWIESIAGACLEDPKEKKEKKEKKAKHDKDKDKKKKHEGSESRNGDHDEEA